MQKPRIDGGIIIPKLGPTSYIVIPKKQIVAWYEEESLNKPDSLAHRIVRKCED